MILDGASESARAVHGHFDLPGAAIPTGRKLTGRSFAVMAAPAASLVTVPRTRDIASSHVGVLALQGDYEAHAVALEEAGARAVPVRLPAELAGLAGLVIPGGESSALLKLMACDGLFDALKPFVKKKTSLRHLRRLHPAGTPRDAAGAVELRRARRNCRAQRL